MAHRKSHKKKATHKESQTRTWCTCAGDWANETCDDHCIHEERHV